MDFSPIKGPEGNIEYLIYLDKSQTGMSEEEVQARLEEVVAESHKILSAEKGGAEIEKSSDFTQCAEG